MNIAIVCHKFGNNGYSANTLDELNQKVAKEFVQLWYTELHENYQQSVVEALDSLCWTSAVQEYFMNHDYDTIHYAVA